jgi:enoyl-CoA hydratase/carnithine racemase
MTGLVTREDSDGVALLTLNRPDVLNALSPKLFEELRAHVDRLASETESVGCVVLRAAGRSFSAGNDLNAIRAGERAPSAHFQAETLDALELLPQPVIASVQGHCYTGALELVLACDLLVVGESAKLADTHGKWGMTPTWGMSQRLPRRIGELRAKQLMFSGRALSGREAVALGLANECVPDAELESRTLALAREIAANSWFTLRTEKTLLRGGAGLPPAQALAYERANSPGAGPDMTERLKAFGKK